MSQVFLFIPRLIDRMGRRIRRSRAGSVLILCVALLVLLALIGTAMISSARVDRYSSVQHTYNTQVDLLVEGVKAMATAAVTGDLYDYSTSPGTYRAPTLPPVGAGLYTSTYDHWDAPDLTGGVITNPPQQDLWLSMRYPQLVDPTIAMSAVNPPIWKAISVAVGVEPGGPSGIAAYTFETPFVPTGPPYAPSGVFPYAHYWQRNNVMPSSVVINGQAYPGLQLGTPGTLDPTLTVLAADADGDGIADSGLFRLPVGQINGVTYYAAVRIVDNNSAINVNTAWSRLYDFGGTYSTIDTSITPGTNVDNPGGGAFGGVLGFYRTNVGLMELLRSYNPTTGLAIPEINDLNTFRWGGAGSASLTPQQETVQVGNSTFTYNYALFTYVNQSDSMENGLNRRLDHPDHNNNATQSFAAFSLSDQAALAAHFCITDSNASSSILENKLSTTLIGTGTLGFSSGTLEYGTVRATPYPADDFCLVGGLKVSAGTWFAQNFDWGQLFTPGGSPVLRLPLRSALVARNPVSNLVPVILPPTSVTGHDGIKDPLITKAMAVTAGNLAYMADYPVQASGSGNVAVVPKTDINTATFNELWRAFWNVMADNADVTEPPNPYAINGDARMFRSTIRDPSITDPSLGLNDLSLLKLSPSQMMELRSALAAINTIDLRNADGNITSKEVPLHDFSGVKPDYTARVFGTERQPFITEVYANTWAGAAVTGTKKNPKGYVAVELFNPYTTPLVLNNYTLGIIDRRSPSDAGGYTPAFGAKPGDPTQYHLSVNYLNADRTDLAGSPVPAYIGGVNSITIQPGQCILLENFADPADVNAGVYAPSDLEDAQYRPMLVNLNATALRYFVPGLQRVIEDSTTSGGELVILRPRNFNGIASFSTTTDNVYDERGTGGATPYNLAELVPIDCYDFTGMVQTPEATGTGNAWHYVRPSAAGVTWRCVYPSLYTINVPAATPRFTGTQVATPFSKPEGEFEDTQINLGTPDALGTNVDVFPPIQLAADDWAGYNKLAPTPPLTPPPTPLFPFGGFARNGDILQVPFIGAYEIRNPVLPTTPVEYFVEMNSVTTDCSFVDDAERVAISGLTDTTDKSGVGDDAQEHLGRFCPITYFDNTTVTNVADGQMLASYQSGAAPSWRYHFAQKLFDYLTVQSPPSDYKPNTDPLAYTSPSNISPVQNGIATAANPAPPPGSTLPQTVNAEESNVGVDGLININTAPWWVLATLPLLPNDVAGLDNNKNGFQDNIENLAKQIVRWRDIDDGSTPGTPHPGGPFRSILDLNRVTAPDGAGNLQFVFRDAINFVRNNAGYDFADNTKLTNTTGTYDTNDKDGDLSPLGAASDGALNDFEERFLMLNRISNLITVRSDTFTVYIVVQGWRNAGTANPQLVVQRRAAMIVDRTGITPVSGASPKITNVPVN